MIRAAINLILRLAVANDAGLAVNNLMSSALNLRSGSILGAVPLKLAGRSINETIRAKRSPSETEHLNAQQRNGEVAHKSPGKYLLPAVCEFLVKNAEIVLFICRK